MTEYFATDFNSDNDDINVPVELCSEYMPTNGKVDDNSKKLTKRNPKLHQNEIECINFSEIIKSDNFRKGMPFLQDNLANEGFYHQDKKNNIAMPFSLVDFARQLVINGDDESKRKFVELVEKYDDKPNGIIDLAHSIRRNQQFSPIILRRIPFGKDKVKYAVCVGERRYFACVYNYAKYEESPVVKAIIKRIDLKDSAIMNWDENFLRRNPSEVEQGQFFRFLAETNDWNLKQVAMALCDRDNFSAFYQYVLGREALTWLPKEQQEKVTSGELPLTKTIEIAKKLKDKIKSNKVDPIVQETTIISQNQQSDEDIIEKVKLQEQDQEEKKHLVVEDMDDEIHNNNLLNASSLTSRIISVPTQSVTNPVINDLMSGLEERKINRQRSLTLKQIKERFSQAYFNEHKSNDYLQALADCMPYLGDSEKERLQNAITQAINESETNQAS